MFIKQADVFAAYVAYTDHEIGRVIQTVEDLGKLDNTLIIYITGDNGTSSEGGPTGTPNEVASVQGVHLPEVVDGIKQNPMDGVSMAYTFDEKNADAPSTHETQYFEMIGDHAIYHDGWILSTKVMRVPWDNSGTADKDPASWPWELYDLSKDWTQYSDVSAQHPEKVRELEKLFWEEAKRNHVLPMDTTTFTRSILPRPNLTAGRTVFSYSGEITGTPNANAPNVLASSYNIKAEVEIPEGGAEGMLVTHGGRFSGYGFYLLKGKPVYTWNLMGLKLIKWEGPDALAPGKHRLEFDFKYDGPGAATLQYGSPSGLGRGGTGYLKVDGKVVATKKMEKTVPMLLQWDESFDVGADTGSPVADADYQTPFRFTGKLDKLTLTIDRPKLSPEDIEKLETAMHANPASD